MEKENNNLQREIDTKDNTNKENQAGLVFILGEMEINIKDNFSTDFDMVVARFMRMEIVI